MSGGDRPFLERWSRRKAAVRAGEPAPEIEAAPVPPTAEPTAPAEDSVDEDAMSDSELLERYELPDPEILTVEDDVAAFMRRGVPARLRRLALRRLLRVNPGIVAHDGLTDYADDYTDAATVVANMKTVFQIGWGARAQVEKALEALGGEAPAEPEAGVEALAEADREDPSLEEAVADPAPAAEPAPSDGPARRRHARMTFRPPEEGSA